MPTRSFAAVLLAGAVIAAQTPAQAQTAASAPQQGAVVDTNPADPGGAAPGASQTRAARFAASGRTYARSATRPHLGTHLPRTHRERR